MSVKNIPQKDVASLGQVFTLQSPLTKMKKGLNDEYIGGAQKVYIKDKFRQTFSFMLRHQLRFHPLEDPIDP